MIRVSLHVEECKALEVDHLLRNAAAWTHHGSVHLTVTHDVYPDGAPRCMFAISDTGSGVNSAGSPDAREAPFHLRQCGQVHVTQAAW